MDIRRSFLGLFTALALLAGQVVALEHGIEHATQVVEQCDKHFACSQVSGGVGTAAMAFAIPEAASAFVPAFHLVEAPQLTRLAFRAQAPPSHRS